MNGLLLKAKQLLRDKKKTDVLLYGLIVGVFLFLLSFTMPKTDAQEKDNNERPEDTFSAPTISSLEYTQGDTSESYVDWLEKRLEDILEKMEGIGEVTVMITLSASKEVCFLKDVIREETIVNETGADGSNQLSHSVNSQELVVVIDNEDGSRQVYVTKEYMPEIEGVLVLAEGTDEQKSFEITEAVQALFSVASHKIKVLKMGAE